MSHLPSKNVDTSRCVSLQKKIFWVLYLFAPSVRKLGDVEHLTPKDSLLFLRLHFFGMTWPGLNIQSHDHCHTNIRYIGLALDNRNPGSILLFQEHLQSCSQEDSSENAYIM